MADGSPAPAPDTQPLKSSQFLADALLGANRLLGGGLGILIPTAVAAALKISVPGWVTWMTLLIMLFLLGGCIKALRDAVKEGNRRLAGAEERFLGQQILLEVKELREPPVTYKAAVCICKVSCAPRLRENSQVTFIIDDGWETPVGTGTVRKRMGNGETLITFDVAYDGAIVSSLETARAHSSKLRVDRHYSTMDAGGSLPPTPQVVGPRTPIELESAPTSKPPTPNGGEHG